MMFKFKNELIYYLLIFLGVVLCSLIFYSRVLKLRLHVI
jgi:hypothetical protein